MSNNNSEERREVSRIDSINFVSYSYLNSDQKIEVEELGRTLDISLGGIKLEVPIKKVPKGETLLHIALEEVVIKVKGIVAHVANTSEGNCEVGIRFEDISGGNKLVLEKFLRETTI